MTFDDLHKLIKKGSVDALKTALSEGVDPNLRNANGVTLLMVAAGTGNTAIGALLIDAGADLDVRATFRQSESRDTALSYAAIGGKPSFVGLLLSRGASLEASPYPGTFESYIDWLETNSAATAEQLAHIRTLVNDERQKRVT